MPKFAVYHYRVTDVPHDDAHEDTVFLDECEDRDEAIACAKEDDGNRIVWAFGFCPVLRQHVYAWVYR